MGVGHRGCGLKLGLPIGSMYVFVVHVEDPKKVAPKKELLWSLGVGVRACSCLLQLRV